MTSKTQKPRGRKKTRRTKTSVKDEVLKDLKKWVPEFFLKMGTKTLKALGL